MPSGRFPLRNVNGRGRDGKFNWRILKMCPVFIEGLLGALCMPSHRVSKFCPDTSGATAIMFGLALPVLLGMAGVAVDYTSWTNQQQKLQKAADAAALAAT